MKKTTQQNVNYSQSLLVNAYRKFAITLLLVLTVLLNSFSQTAPTAQSLPYTQDFSGLSFSSTTFPAGWQGWALAGSPPASFGPFRTTAPTLNALLLASSTASNATGGIHNYNLKIGMLPSGSIDPSLCLGIITTGKNNVVVNFDIMTIRNPYDGTTNTRINGGDLQYNVGAITGTWTSVSGIANGIYQNNTTTQITTVTSPQNLQSKSFTLPAACNNQPLVYLRWVMRDISGAGSRPSFAVDNISICATSATPTIAISGPTTFCSGASASYTSSITNGGTTPSYQWKKNGGNIGTNSSSVTISGLIAGDQVTCVLTSNLSCITSLTATSNTITIGTPNSPPSLNAAITNTICPGSHTGAINLTVSGGTGPYTVCWDTVNTANGAMFGVTFANKTPAHPYFGTGSAFGYKIDGVEGKALTLTRGITYSFNVATTASHPFFVSTSVVGGTTSTLVANGQSGAPTGVGTVTFTPNNTHPSALFYACQFHQYMGYNINIQNGYCVEDLNNLGTGTYTVIVTDANGCTTSAQYTVGEDPSSLSATATITAAACSGSNSGAIDLNVTGGTGPYTVCWDTMNIANGPEFGVMVNSMTPSNPFYGLGNNLTYYIDGVESKTLSLMKGITYSFNILSPGHPWHISTDIIGGNANNIVTSGQSGAPNDNGTVLFTPNASHPTHLYYLCSNHAYMGSNVNIADGYCTEDISSLAPGVYSVLVTDANGCTFTTQFTVGTAPSTLSASGTPVNVTCQGAHNGSIDLDVTGGTGPYTICWDTTNIANGPMFGVTVDVETPAHAYFGQGIGLDFYIDGVEAPALDLVKGITYSFDVFNPGHPWHISTDFIGGSSGGLVSNGQSGAPTDMGTVTFTPNASHPSLLYYVCENHAYMGYNINIVDGYCIEDPTNLGPGIYSVIVTDANGCSTTSQFTITEPDAIVLNASGNGPICEGSNINLSSSASGGTGTITTQWNGPNGFSSSDENPVITNASPLASGDYVVTVTDGNLCTAEFTVNVIVETNPSASAGSNTSVCSNLLSYSLTAATASNYSLLTWSTDGDGSFDDPSSLQPVYTFGPNDVSNGSVTLTLTADANSPCINNATGNIILTLLSSSIEASGILGSPEAVCTGLSSDLSVAGGNLGSGASWQWYTGTCGGTLAGSGPTFNTGPLTSATTFYVRAEGTCNTTNCSSIIITIAPDITGSSVLPFTGTAYACSGNNFTISCALVAGASAYLWDGPTGTTFDGTNPSVYSTNSNSVNVTFGTTNSSGYNICVQATNSCGSAVRKCKFIRSMVSTPGIISAANNRTIECANTSASYSIGAVGGASGYSWSITGNATITPSGTSVIVNFGPAWTGGTLCVSSLTPCFTSPTRCLTLSHASAIPGAISGPATVCPGASAIFSVPSVSGAASYNWTLPPLASGSSLTNTINASFAPSYNLGNISVSITSICGITSPSQVRTINRGTPGTPAAINGSAAGLCGQTTVFNCPSVTSATSYTWSVPSGAFINSGQNSTAINVTFGTFTTGTVCVTANNACGSGSARCIPVKGSPTISGNISYTPNPFCANATGVDFIINPVFGTVGYNWNFPSGVTTILNLGNEQIVNWGTIGGTVSVTAANPCGNATKTTTIVLTCRESGSDEIINKETVLTVYPNPANGVLNVDYTSPEKQNIFIEIIDIAGRIITSENKSAYEGFNHSSVDISKLAPGIYTIHLKGLNMEQPVKIVVE